jgi:tetratricopeptide (TPR) repeat protein
MNISATLNNIASEMVVSGDLIASRKIFDEALAIGREIHSDSTVATALVNLGEVRLELGDTDGAESAFQEAFSTFQKNNEKGKSAYPLVGWASSLQALAISRVLKTASNAGSHSRTKLVRSTNRQSRCRVSGECLCSRVI